jgi:hypothetical protein
MRIARSNNKQRIRGTVPATPGQHSTGAAGISGLAYESLPVHAHGLSMAASSHYTILGDRKKA